MICAAAAEEEHGVLFPERVEAPVRTDSPSCCLRRTLPAMDSPQKMLEHVRRIGDFCDTREVDPGEHPRKIEGRIVALCLGQDHRHDREVRIARLTHKGERSL